MELTFAQIPINIKPKPKKREYRKKIDWTPGMIQQLKERFPFEFNRDLAKDLGISWRSLVRKARELGIEKEPNFCDKHRTEAVKKILLVRKPNPEQAKKGFVIPNSEQYRFKKGHTPRVAWDKELVARIHEKRNETIRRDRIRAKCGLTRLTKFKLI